MSDQIDLLDRKIERLREGRLTKGAWREGAKRAAAPLPEARARPQGRVRAEPCHASEGQRGQMSAHPNPNATYRALREQEIFRRQQLRFRHDRICEALRHNPDLTMQDLCERFNEEEKVLRRILAKHGLRPSGGSGGYL
jgi:hypothetical protein